MNIEGIILAAGFSSRANRFKMTMDILGKTLLERCIDSMYDFCSRIIIVGGYRIEEIRPIAGRYAKTELIYNESYQEGMLSSVKLAFRYIYEERFFFTPGDYPIISQNTYKILLEHNGDIVIPSFEGEKGHPILITSEVARKFLNIESNLTLREFIKVQGYEAVEVKDEGILIDVDTEEDYNRVLERLMGNYG